MSFFSDIVSNPAAAVSNPLADIADPLGAIGNPELATNQSGFNTFLDNLGFGTSPATQNAQNNIQAAIAAYAGLKPPTLTSENPYFASASQQSPTAFNQIAANPADQQAERDQVAALSNIANNGGRTAAFDANLAAIQQGENANAAGQRGAVMQNAAARGISGSGTELMSELAANQNAQNAQNAQDLGVAANAQNTALSAGMGAAQVGSNLYSQDYGAAANKAAAQDAINRFNSGQSTAINQYNTGIGNQAQQYNTGLQQQGYQNQYQKAQGIANADMGGTNFWQNQANMGAQQAGNLLGGAVKLGTAGMAASGGEVPGDSLVPGDSTFNDFISAKNSGPGPNINVSPHEVVVPVSLRHAGTDKQIANFVRNPPKIPTMSSHAGQNKEAMLSALKNIAARRRMIA